MLSEPCSCANAWLLGYRRSSTLPLPAWQSTTPAAHSMELQLDDSLAWEPYASLVPCTASKWNLQTLHGKSGWEEAEEAGSASRLRDDVIV